MIVRLLAWWRRRHERPLDWADPESPIYCPELVKPGGYVRHVSSSQPVARAAPVRYAPEAAGGSTR
jgi:hypothetical protein